tara:strand:+ start:753 stop:1115 length:363 start_codon:yes stop_codon:yes gene_type:complete
MKLNQLKSIVKQAVKEAIQEEMKDILLEAIKTPSRQASTPIMEKAVEHKPLQKEDKMKLRENMMSVLDGMRPGANGTLNATSADVPLQVGGTVDTTSPNGSLPQGNVSMDQIMGLMNSKG